MWKFGTVAAQFVSNFRYCYFINMDAARDLKYVDIIVHLNFFLI
jgi:hypothetical protein